MLTLPQQGIKSWLRSHPNPRIRAIFGLLKAIRQFELPTIPFVNKLIYTIWRSSYSLLGECVRILFYTPVFKGRLQACGKRLYLYTGIPFVTGPLSIQLGDDCRVSGQTTLSGFSGREMATPPQLIVGNNVDIGWQTTIAVGTQVILEDNVRIAGKGFLFGYSGHPLDAKARAAGLPDTPNQVGQIHLEADVWLGSSVSVCSGVTIGRGTVVATGSVVTKDLPPYVLAGGNPARVIRSLAVTDEPPQQAIEA